MPSWQPIAERRRTEEYTQQQRQWQLQRRGAYVCFNTLYDRGFRFGGYIAVPCDAGSLKLLGQGLC